MSKIPPSIESVVSESFEVIDVIYYPDSVEFLLSEVSPKDTKEKFLEVLNKVSSTGLVPRLYVEDGQLKLKISIQKPVISRRNLILALNLLAIITVLISGWVVASGMGDLLKELGMSSNILIDILLNSVAMLTFLAAHGVVHTIIRRNGRSWLSLFIPAPPPPLGFGTFGDILVVDEPLVNREEMLDIGLYGLVAGLAVSLIISLLGLLQSPAIPSELAKSWVKEGKAGYLPTPLIFLIMERFLTPEGGKVLLLSPLAMAGLGTLFITFLVSMPILPWDGGYVAYSLMPGDKIRKVDWLAVIGITLINPILGALMLLAIFLPSKSKSLDEYSEVPSSKKRKSFVVYLIILLLSLPIIQ